MQRLEVSGAVRPLYESLGVRRFSVSCHAVSTIWAYHVPVQTCWRWEPHYSKPRIVVTPTEREARRCKSSQSAAGCYKDWWIRGWQQSSM